MKVIVIGSGNLAWNLIEIFEQTPNIQLIQVFSRNAESLKTLSCSCPTTTNWEELSEADLYLLAVSDRAIISLGEKAQNKGLWAHCSGSVDLRDLPATIRRGVFYPLQSFTKGRKSSFSDLPILLALWVGTGGVLVSLMFALFLVYSYLIGNITVPGYATLAMLSTLFGSVGLMMQGVLGSYIWRTFENTKQRPLRLISRVCEHDPHSNPELTAARKTPE